MEYNLEKRRVPKVATPSAIPKKPATPTGRGSPITPIEKAGGAPKKEENNKAANATKYENKKDQKEKKIYTEADIQTLLDGYINVHPTLWDYIPTGAHIRFIKKAGGTRTERFKPGGFVKNHFTGDGGKKFLMIETKPNGRPGQDKYRTFPIAYEDMEEIWKKYDRTAFIEIHLISTSLAQKKKQIEDLTARVGKLETLLGNLVDRLTKK